MQEKPIFSATHIVKRFGPTIALNDVDINIYPHEIRGFIGENGSGKSTMSQIMTGIYFKNSGTMTFKGQEWNPKSMMDALNNGIGIAVQENGTISGISVAENIFLCELDQFSGVNFFEKNKIVSFSRFFDIDLKPLINIKDKYISLIKAKESNVKDGKKAINEFAKKIALEHNSKKKNYITALKNEYDTKLDVIIKEYDDKSKKIFEEINNDSSIDDSYKNKQYKYYLSLYKKEYKIKRNALDLSYQNDLAAIANDLRSINNYKINLINELEALADISVKTKFKNFWLKLVFGKVVNQNKLNRHAKQILANIGVYNINPKMPMGMYDIQSRKLVEIAKVLAKDPDIFIVDETTTALSEDGRQILYKKMNELKNNGKAVLFISHDLDEIMDKCDTLTVLRDGSIVANMTKAEYDPNVIKKYMIGRELKGDYYRADYTPSRREEILLSAKDINLNGRLKNVNLDLHAGEIVGIGGLSDCGMHDLGKILFGAIHPSSGTVLTGENLDIIVKNELVAMKNKIGYLPKDRDVEALALNDSIYNNIALASINNILKFKCVVSKRKESEIVKNQVDYLQIKCNSSSDLVRTLSGGNKQKVSLGKWLGNESKILILDCPTRGVDIGVKQFIYQLMIKLKNEGYAILMISEELPELIGMSDRLIIMKNGQIAHEFPRSNDLAQEQIVEYML